MAQERSSHASKFGDSGYACACPSSSESNSSRLVGPPCILSFEWHLSSLDVDRIWTLTFSIRSENAADGHSENRWLLSLGLADHSMPAYVDGDLVISGSPPSTHETDEHEPTFTLPIRRDVSELKPGSESAIRIRLDDGPMGPHLLNEYVNMRPFFSLITNC